MNMQEFIDGQVRALRAMALKNSPQLRLGELILKLKPILERRLQEAKEVPSVSFDFGSAIPTFLHSWRGAYEELALGYKLTGYDGNDHFDDVKLDVLIKELESAIGKTYPGWKGGDFEMTKDTPVWVSNPGNASNSAIVDVLDKGYQVILLTQYCEY